MTAIAAGSDIIGTLCAFCRKPLEEGQHAADLFVYERYDPTELKFIELAHRECAIADGSEGWQYDHDHGCDHTAWSVASCSECEECNVCGCSPVEG